MSPRSSEHSIPKLDRQFLLKSGAVLTAVALLAACGDREAGAQAGNNTSSTTATNNSETPATSPSHSEGPSPSDLPSVSPTPETSPTASPEVTLDLGDMGAEKFGKLPVDVRTDYALSNYYILSENGSLFDFLDQELTNGNHLYDHNPYRMPLDKYADPADIYLAHIYAEAVSRAWKPDIKIAGGGDIDGETAMKMIAGVAYEPQSKVYLSHLDSIANSTRVGRIPDKDINGNIVLDNTQPNDVKQKDGTVRPERTLTVNSSGETTTEKFVFVDKSDVLGEGNGLWLLVSRTPIKQ